MFRETSFKRSLMLALFFGLAFTVTGYDYGLDNHVEQLPIVLRFVDGSFLPNDFFVNASAGYGPRWFFARFVAFWVPLASLEGAYFILTLAGNLSIAAVSFFAGRGLFRGSNLAGVLAASLVMAAPGFDLGGSTNLAVPHLVPSVLAMPLVLLAIWSAIQQKLWQCVFVSGLAGLFHPLLGLEAGALGLAAVVAAQLPSPEAGPLLSPENGSGVNRWRNPRLWAALALLGLWALSGLAITRLAPQIEAGQFLSILAYFRHPHHYLPSTFGLTNYAAAASFLVATFLCVGWWRRSAGPSRQAQVSVMAILGAILLLCLGGYVFVEVFPTRVWTTIQAFRLLALVKWLGLLMISGVIAALLRRGDDLAYPFLAASLSPYALAFATLVRSSGGWVRKHFPPFGIFTEQGPVLLAIAFLLAATQELAGLVVAGVYLLFILTLITWPPRLFYGALAAGAAWLLLLSVYRDKVEEIPVLADFQPQFTLEEISGEEQDIARFALENTPEQSLFLTPPDLGEFRIFARRAIVIDFKAFPFQEHAMLEWRKRIVEIYGRTRTVGYLAIEEMELNYEKIDDRRIRAIQARYGITHAILFATTPSRYPVLYENEEYKLVRLPVSSASPGSR